MKTIFLILFLILGLAQNIYSQYTQQWVARYNGQNNSFDEASKLVIDNSGNIYVTGDSQHRYLTVKYNSNGQELWTQSYHGGYFFSLDIPSDIVSDSYGNVYVTGRARATDYYPDYTTVKYTPGGNETWIGIYDSPNNNLDAATSMVLDKNGKLYVTGYSLISDSNYNLSFNTIKYNPDGSIDWISRFFENLSYPLSGYAPPPDIAVDSSGNVIIAGTYGEMEFQNVIVKYNSTGQQLWRKDLPSQSDICKLAIDRSGNIYFSGICEVNSINTIKYDPNGDTLWTRKYVGSNIKKIEVDAFSNVYIAGTSNPRGYLTIKYDSNGNHIWSDVDSIGYELNAMTIDNIGNVYETGNTSGNVNYYSVKYNTNGVKIWSSLYNGPGNGNDFAMDIAVDNLGNIYVTGLSVGIGTNSDYATIKYSLITNSNDFSTALPEHFILHQNYPNPFNPTTNINYQLPITNYVSLKIYDIDGKLAATLVNVKQNAGTYSAEFNGANYPSGIYYYKLEAGDFSQVRKMILLK